ncbi:carbonate dehydratase [bacterium]|nr:carbonate dehydratase [bacterium]
MGRTKASDLLLLKNRAWAEETKARDAGFFDRLAQTQSPRFLWIGCADSRVPADAITGTRPGEIFVHRNIANLVVHTDLNMLSVLSYAVNVLEVDHVIVCGHHGCGGVHAAMGTKDLGLINKWLRNIKDVCAANRAELDAIADPHLRENRLVELNVMAQVGNLMKTTIIQRAWKKRRSPWLHAWVYDLGDGILQELEAVAPGTPLEYPFALDVDGEVEPE